jgi:hypothetical protein
MCLAAKRNKRVEGDVRSTGKGLGVSYYALSK